MGAILLVLRLFLCYFLDCLISELFILFDKQRYLAENFLSVSCRFCWIFKLCLGSFSVFSGVSFQSGVL
jgi:hypothetical protein